MPQKCGAGILGAHTAAVVGDAHKGHTSVPDLHSDLRGTCIHGIFQQFLRHGCRTLNHFTGGY